MKPHNYSSEAVILAKHNYSEADAILILFSKNMGKLALVAKGVRKLSSRKRGSLEIFNFIKFSAVRGKNLDVITEAEVIKNYSPIRRNLKKASLAFYFMEVVGRISRDGEANLELFNLLLEFMGRVEEQSTLRSLRLEFIHKLLVISGFWPKNKPLLNPDEKLEEILERTPSTLRVGKRILE
jgi:DNA repair protein RecO (recombination protein O)